MAKSLHILKILLTFALWIGWFGHQLTRGMSIAPSTSLMIGVNKSIDNMSRKKTLEQLLKDFASVHGDRYDYSLINDDVYKNNRNRLTVVCKKHNYRFCICANNHLSQKQGCPICANEQRRISNTGNVRKRPKLVYGVGVNDYEGNTKCNYLHIQSYHTWVQMLKRCYSEEYLNRHETYRGCSVCSQWLSFSEFKKWYDKNNVDGYCLDKDILVKGNKVYSHDTCCFVPNEVNVLLCKSDKKRGNMPIGVHEVKNVNGSRYVAYLNNNIKKHFHLGTFDTPEEAFYAYKVAKEAYIKEIATKYYSEGKITQRVYEALLNYKVEITD